MFNGIIVIDKAAGMTSGDVVYKLRRLLKQKKIGHAGTLDPEVTGVLPIALGQATKLIELMHERPKAYVGEGMLGLATDSYDLEGKILAERALSQPVSDQAIKAAMEKFTGEIVQQPPIYSAVRVNGKRLYEYAREGIPVERPKRTVHVFRYDLTAPSQFDPEKGRQTFTYEVECSKGTYVRSLVNDLGEELGLPSVMTKLRRTASSGYKLQDAVTLEELADNLNHAEDYIQPIDSFFADYQQVDLDAALWQQVKNGAWIKLPLDADKVALRYNKTVKAIYRAKGQGLYCPDLMLLSNE
ncbi:tRNA pseudouridine(55) synthase TruB [Lactobacillus delbrueckii]|uniref:tRNA pseudouridine(55) synthase TruB n=1 Tax=Lactobacillus delbrueckii TaxID=1584 RepID=UPI001E59F9EE|nr:tRNA pseudouridine(55) synthase TruB [Lactobacillus delbrueckii]MCD5532860.1 tRNA pseudouridine(55) synthase TruB [Lactobacillus delbrueckii subsp. lactis]